VNDSANSNFNQIPPEDLCIVAHAGRWRIKAFLPEIYIEKEGDVVRPVWCDIDLFYSVAR
jgi:hypothetical protein